MNITLSPLNSGSSSNLDTPHTNIDNIISQLGSPFSSPDTPRIIPLNFPTITPNLDVSSPTVRGTNVDDRPETQPVSILSDVVAFVEVRTLHDNRSKAIGKKLEQLGATVLPKFTKDVTHVIFKDGKQSTVEKAQKKGVHLVSVLWIESCEKNEEKVSEKSFPARLPDQSTPQGIAKLRRLKSMQPKDLDEEYASSAERVNRKYRRKEKADRWKVIQTPVTPLQFQHRRQFFVAETQPMSPDSDDAISYYSPRIVIPETPPSMRAKMQELKMKKLAAGEIDSLAESPMTNSSPIQKRLFASESTDSFRRSISPRGLQSPHAINKAQSPHSHRSSMSPLRLDCSSKTATPQSTSTSTVIASYADTDVDSDEHPLPRFPNVHSQIAEFVMSPFVDSDSEPMNIVVNPKPRVKSKLTGALSKKLSMSKADIEEQSRKDETAESKTGSSRGTKSVVSSGTLKSRNVLNKNSATMKEILSRKDNTGRGSRRSVVSAVTKEPHSVIQTLNNSDELSQILRISNTGKKSPNTCPVEKRPIKRLSSLSTTSALPEETGIESVAPVAKKGRGRRKTLACIETLNPISPSQREKSPESTACIKRGRRKSVAVVQKPSTPVKLNPSNAEGISSRSSHVATLSPSPLQSEKSTESTACVKRGRRKSVAVVQKPSTPVKLNPSNAEGISSRSSHVAALSPLKVPAPSTPVSVKLSRASRRKSCIPPTLKSLPEQALLDTSDVPNASSPNVASCSKETQPYKMPTRLRRRSEALSVAYPPSNAELLGLGNLKEVSASQTSSVLRNTRRKSTVISRNKSLEISNSDIELDTTVYVEKCPKPAPKSKFSRSSNNTMNVSEALTTDSTYMNLTKSRLSVEEFRPSQQAKTTCGTPKRIHSVASLQPSQMNKYIVSSSSDSEDSFSPDTSQEREAKTVVKPSNNSATIVSNKTKPNKSGKSQQKPAIGKKRSMTSSSSSNTGSSDSSNRRKKQKSKKVKSTDNPNLPSIVCTSLHFESLQSARSGLNAYSCFREQDVARAVTKQLGGFSLQELVDNSTTHLICGGNRRTLNVLGAIARGCWLLSYEWMLKSLEAGHWLQEQPYEQEQFFPAAKVSRLEREAAQVGQYNQRLFSGVGPVFVGCSTSPPHSDLHSLLQLCGAPLTSSLRNASLCVGIVSRGKAVSVTEQWVLDSITAHKTLPFSTYQMQ